MKLFLLPLAILLVQCCSLVTSNCGGNLMSDDDSLKYPPAGEQVSPGDLCVWTIHLSTRKDFRLNFTQFQASSGNNSCSSAGVRIYGMSNGVPSGDQESYTFCDESPPPGFNLFLGGTVAVVVFYTVPGNPNNVTGFEMNWHGVALDTSQTIHISNRLTNSTGQIRYPTTGGYPANLAATWLIDSPGAGVDLNINYVLLEDNCNFPQDPCVCDALMVFEVANNGIISEAHRICDDLDETRSSGLNPKVIVGLFTDSRSEVVNGGGFELSYQESEGLPEFVTSERCGELLHSRHGGRISYKVNTTYENYETCSWIIRIEGSDTINFNMTESQFAGIIDMVRIRTYQRVAYPAEPLLDTNTLQQPGAVTMRGSIAVVTFATDLLNVGRGFTLEYEGNHEASVEISPQSGNYITDERTGVIRHPAEGQYANNELTVLVLSPPGYTQDQTLNLQTSLQLNGLQSGCLDWMRIYKISLLVPQDWTVCAELNSTNYNGNSNDYFIVLFMSDSSTTNAGFSWSWTWS